MTYQLVTTDGPAAADLIEDLRDGLAVDASYIAGLIDRADLAELDLLLTEMRNKIRSAKNVAGVTIYTSHPWHTYKLRLIDWPRVPYFVDMENRYNDNLTNQKG
jgi:hypothetical protein